MATTFLKRQKEMKRLEKQREKAERRAQKRLADRQQKELPPEEPSLTSDELLMTTAVASSESQPQK